MQRFVIMCSEYHMGMDLGHNLTRWTDILQFQSPVIFQIHSLGTFIPHLSYLFTAQRILLVMKAISNTAIFFVLVTLKNFLQKNFRYMRLHLHLVYMHFAQTLPKKLQFMNFVFRPSPTFCKSTVHYFILDGLKRKNLLVIMSCTGTNM
jgi:hypothetical protein